MKTHEPNGMQDGPAPKKPQAPQGELVPLVLKVRYAPLDSLYSCLAVLGSCESLGCWDPARALRVGAKKGIVREVEVSIPRDTPVQWKWLLLDKRTNTVHEWEARENREILLGSRRMESLETTWEGDDEKWHPCDGAISAGKAREAGPIEKKVLEIANSYSGRLIKAMQARPALTGVIGVVIVAVSAYICSFFF